MDLDFTNEIIEKLLFKKTLTDHKYLNIIASIFDKRWFKTENLSLLFKLTLNFYKKYNTAPSYKVLLALVQKYIERSPDESELTSIQTLLIDIKNLDMNLSDEVLGTNLKEYIRKRALYFAMFDNIENLETKSDEVIDTCLTRFDKVQKITFQDVDLGMNYFDESAMEKHWDYLLNPESKVKTLWNKLDYFTNGGFYKNGRCLVLMMAGPGLGKSLWLSNLAVNLLKQNLNVVVISLEMSQDIYAQRFDAHISEDNINRLSQTAEISREKIKSFYKQYPNSNLFIKEFPPKSIKPVDIDKYLEKLKEVGHKFDAVIVDYINLVLPNKSQDTMYADGKCVSEELRALSYKYTVPFISAVQANTDGINNENIDMQNCSESRGIVHTCDALFALYQLPDDRENGIINCRILKNRFGGCVGKLIQYKMNPENLTLKDISFSQDDFDVVDTELVM